MANRRLRGDAPTQAQITRLSSSASGNISLEMNGKIGVQADEWDATAIAALWNASTLPEFAEVTASVDGDDVLLTADEPGRPFELRGLVNGEPLADDEQAIIFDPMPTGGTFPLGFDGQTAAAIAWPASQATIKAALEGLSNLAEGEVIVTGELGNWRVRFVGAKSDTDQPQMTTSRADLTGGTAGVLIETVQDGTGETSPLVIYEEQAGGAGVNEQRRFRFTADPGVALSAITLRFQSLGATGDAYSVTFPGDASLETIKAALGGLRAKFTGAQSGLTYGADNLTLSGTLANSWVNPTDGILVEFGGIWAGEDITRDIELVPYAGAAATLGRTTVQDGDPGPNEVQSLRLIGEPVGDGFRLRLGSIITDPIQWNASAITIVSTINAALGANSVRLSIVAPWEQLDHFETLLNAGYTGDGIIYIEFYGNGYQSTDVDLLEVLTVGGSEIQSVTLTNSPWKGDVTLTLGDQTAIALDWDTTAGELEAALEDLSNVGEGNVDCFGGPWPATIFAEFDSSLGNLPQMTAVHTLTNADVAVSTIQDGGAAVIVTEDQRSRGPAHWDDPIQWSEEAGAAGVPGSNDIVTVDLDGIDLLYGILQRCEFTVDAATNRLTLATGRATFWPEQALRVKSSDALPGGLDADVLYYPVNIVGGTLQLATAPGGDPVDISSAGTGTHLIGVRLAKLFVDARFSGDLGLPRTSDRGYDEYRARGLTLWADEIQIGSGDGSGSGRTILDTGDVQTSIEILSTGGSSESGVPACLWKGHHAQTLIINAGGDIGVAVFPEDSATFREFRQYSGEATLGRNVAVTNIRRFGGTLRVLGASVEGEVIQ
ncbi:MAG: hypothetical protein KF777_13635 [Planctomycetaceae bacterium]|nr:hypothetical protein [Planctomycetaceae bacterium]